jgi:hypothetical protein
MKVTNWVIVGLVCLVGSSGCQQYQNRITLLQQELRLYEDRVYQLQDRVRSAESSLADSSEENGALREKLDKSDSDSTSSDGPDLKIEVSEGSSSGSIEMLQSPPAFGLPLQNDSKEKKPADSSSPNPPAFKGPPSTAPPGSGEAPRFNSGREDDRKNRKDYVALAPNRSVQSRDTGSLTEADRQRILAIHDPEKASEGSRRVETIELSRAVTQPVDQQVGLTGEGGSEAIFTLLQAFNKRGDLVRAAGPVAIVAIDPTRGDASARLARWDFEAREVARRFVQTGTSRGFHFDLRWPDGAPNTDRILLFSRYTTADGRKLETRISLDLSNEDAGAFGKQELTPPSETDEISRPRWSPFR